MLISPILWWWLDGWYFARDNVNMVGLVVHIQLDIQLPKRFKSVMIPILMGVTVIIFSETLSFNFCIVTSEWSFALKGVSRIVHFENCQWVRKYVIIHICSLKHLLYCDILSTQLVYFNSIADSFKSSSDNKTCICHKGWHAVAWPL